MKHVIPVGTSEPQDFELRDKGVAINGSGFTVELEISTSRDAVVAPEDPPTVAWLSQSAGTVRVTGTEELPVGNYFVRFKLIDGGGKVGFCPNGDQADLWSVVPVPKFP